MENRHMNSVEISHLNFAFKNQTIFKDLSLQIPYGSITGIVGPNGVGKSVLFKIIAGLIIPDSGSVVVNNTNISLQKFPTSFGALIEEPGFVERLSGYDNLKMLAGIQGKIAAADINRVLKLVGLWPARDKKVKNYSLGMKKKLGIAQAIMEKPQVIILDEPMNALDEDSVIQMRELFKKLAHNNVSIIIASHNMEDINVLCDKIYKIKDHTLVIKTI
jgi:ABC-2 type transport system ATP-binding protein